MEKHAEDARRKAMVIDIDMLVPKDHLLRKIEKVMDYDWLYERLNPLYNDKVGRPGTDPVVLIKMVLIQHLFGMPAWIWIRSKACRDMTGGISACRSNVRKTALRATDVGTSGICSKAGAARS